jgi:hypothetical protein
MEVNSTVLQILVQLYKSLALIVRIWVHHVVFFKIGSCVDLGVHCLSTHTEKLWTWDGIIATTLYLASLKRGKETTREGSEGSWVWQLNLAIFHDTNGFTFVQSIPVSSHCYLVCINHHVSQRSWDAHSWGGKLISQIFWIAHSQKCSSKNSKWSNNIMQ